MQPALVVCLSALTRLANLHHILICVLSFWLNSLWLCVLCYINPLI